MGIYNDGYLRLLFIILLLLLGRQISSRYKRLSKKTNSGDNDQEMTPTINPTPPNNTPNLASPPPQTTSTVNTKTNNTNVDNNTNFKKSIGESSEEPLNKLRKLNLSESVSSIQQQPPPPNPLLIQKDNEIKSLLSEKEKLESTVSRLQKEADDFKEYEKVSSLFIFLFSFICLFIYHLFGYLHFHCFFFLFYFIFI